MSFTNLIKVPHPAPELLAETALWLAFQAAHPTGLGFLHLAVATSASPRDVCAAARMDHYTPIKGMAYFRADYIFGRMMKLWLLAGNGHVAYSNEDRLMVEYQSWVGTYPSYAALITKAAADLAK